MRIARISGEGLPGTVEATVLGSGEGLAIGGRSVTTARVRFEPPTDGLVYGVILNDRESLRSLGEALSAPPYQTPPKAPVLYIKPYNTHVGHGAGVPLPAGAERVEVFAALGIVFGSPASRLPEARALGAVRGYTIVADLSLPQQNLHRPPIREKCFDRSCPIGPWITDRQEIADPDALEVQVFVNGTRSQRHSLRDLVRPVAGLIAAVSEFLTLHPGDVLLAGVPVQAPTACAGDSVAVEIPAIGRLEFRLEERIG